MASTEKSAPNPAANPPDPAQQAAGEVVAALAEDDSEHTLVKLVAPWQVDEYRVTLDSGDTLSVNRTGVPVPNGDVDSLIEDAARNGVRLEAGN